MAGPRPQVSVGPSERSTEKKRKRPDDDTYTSEGLALGPSDNNPARRFSCPLGKHSPLIYPDCARLKGWEKVHRVKEHIYRVHVSIFYPRCHQKFATEALREVHLALPDPCRRTDLPLPDGISASTARELRVRKKLKTDRPITEEERWNNVYRITFPGADLPSSPYIDPIISLVVSRGGSPDSEIARLVQFVQHPPARVQQEVRLFLQQELNIADELHRERVVKKLCDVLDMAASLIKSEGPAAVAATDNGHEQDEEKEDRTSGKVEEPHLQVEGAVEQGHGMNPDAGVGVWPWPWVRPEDFFAPFAPSEDADI